MGKYRSPAPTLRKVLSRMASSLARHERSAELARRGERFFKYMQGKTSGAFTHENEVRAISHLLPARGAVVFDLGANRGQWTRELYRLAGDRVARVFAFEPSQACAEALASLPFAGLTVVGSAVGSRRGNAVLHSDRSGSIHGSLHHRYDFPQGVREKVGVVTLDDLVATTDLEVIHFLKMDIEGNELEALRGASALLGARRVCALSFEFGNNNVNSRTFFRDYWELLTAHGFRLFRITGPKLLPIREYSTDLEDFVGVTNYVATLSPSAVDAL